VKWEGMRGAPRVLRGEVTVVDGNADANKKMKMMMSKFDIDGDYIMLWLQNLGPGFTTSDTKILKFTLVLCPVLLPREKKNQLLTVNNNHVDRAEWFNVYMAPIWPVRGRFLEINLREVCFSN